MTVAICWVSLMAAIVALFLTGHTTAGAWMIVAMFFATFKQTREED